MSQCSFLVKGWSVTLVSALFALAAKDSDARYAFIPYIPVATFWTLDGFFLFQERVYRCLFSAADKGSVKPFDMNAAQFKGGSNTWLGSMFSKTLILFHGVLLFVVFFAMFYLARRAPNGP
jgi:hypothetical protein